ncbi:MAG: serine/threonine-protein phosphatase [Deltaproteobacteria bacterium]|nr:serine/threonine-protein phosphatase [Deltaproteobacteria bacterium]
MKLSSVAKTDVGRRREHNEDAFLIDDALGLYAVADGMGGHAAGEVASNEALETLRDHILQHEVLIADFVRSPDNDLAEQVRRTAEQSVRLAAYQVFGLTELEPERKGMGTTLSMLMILPQAAFVAHVGDSRIYMLRDGKTAMLTSDHTFVAAMVAKGKMTAEQARRSKYSNVLMRAVGSKDYVEVETRLVRYRPEDVFLLCSDGMHGYFKPGELEQLVDCDDLGASLDKLVQLALDRGGKDNITGVMVRVD